MPSLASAACALCLCLADGLLLRPRAPRARSLGLEASATLEGSGAACKAAVVAACQGAPPNGVGANEEQVTTAFSIILEDPNVKGILVNIFGGIMRCDIIARGVIAAVENLGLEVPLVVRLAGTNVDEGKAILAASTLNIHPADDLADGAERIVALIGGGDA